MDYNNNNYNDTTTKEIDTHYAQETASDFVVETTPLDANDFTPAPEEYVYNPEADAETADDNYTDGQDEQAATLDDGYSIDGAYGKTTDMYEAETAEDYDADYASETAEDWDEEYAEDYDTRDENDKMSYSVSTMHRPSDETAATIDEWYTTDKPSARERCQLDDYEIISDVLGSEKQIVKLYSTALCEASEEPFRNLIRENLDEAAADQYKAFEFMQKRGMYPTEQASEENITKAKQQFAPLCRNSCCNTCID